MKMIIEISGGRIVNIVSTQECSIYIVDHDNLKRSGGYDPNEKVALSDLVDAREVMHPDHVTGELDSDDNDDTPGFDECLNSALEPYQAEALETIG